MESLPAAAERHVFLSFSFSLFSFAWAVCPSEGFLNGLTTPSLEMLGQDIRRLFAAMENAHRD